MLVFFQFVSIPKASRHSSPVLPSPPMHAQTTSSYASPTLLASSPPCAGLTHPSGSGSPAQRHSRVSSSGWRALSPLERYLSHEGDPSPIGHATVNEHGALEEVEVDEGMEFHDAMEHAGGERDEYEQGYGGDDMYGAEVEGGEFGGGYHEPYPEDAYPGEMLQRWDGGHHCARQGDVDVDDGIFF